MVVRRGPAVFNDLEPVSDDVNPWSLSPNGEGEGSCTRFVDGVACGNPLPDKPATDDTWCLSCNAEWADRVAASG